MAELIGHAAAALASFAWPLKIGALAVVGAAAREGSNRIGAAASDIDLSQRALDSAIDTDKRKRALVVGAGAVGIMLAKSLEAGGRYRVIGFVDDELVPQNPDWPLLGARDRTRDLIIEHTVDHVFLAYAPTWQQMLAEDLVSTCPDVQVHVIPTPYEAMMQTAQVESFNGVALVRLISRSECFYDVVKRAVDFTVAVIGLIVLAPVLAMVAALIKLTSRGPVIFAQERVGLKSRIFTLYKFRTMVADAEQRSGPVLANGLEDDRLTPLGRILRKFRIDEFPQLLNVLKGEMSVVGPRPERPFFVEKFTDRSAAYARRHTVRPGITGLAQVCGGYHTDARDKLRFDLIYVAHRSLMLDINILWRTMYVVFFDARHSSDS